MLDPKRPWRRTDPSGRLSKAEVLLFDEQGRFDVRSLDLPRLEVFVEEELGENAAAARRIYKALWQHSATQISELHDVGKRIRLKLEKKAFLSVLVPEVVLPSADGTVKYLWRLRDGHRVESVLIPDGDRLTLCISSQVGCAMACTFCLTGDLGLLRHMNPSEIASQPFQIQQQLGSSARITNLVLMGMGEPLHNLDNLVEALNIALHDHGLGFSHRRVTVSTVGLVPKMAELAARLPVNLAVSLNASSEAQRRELMPITKKWSVESLLQACRDFPLPAGKRITFEYVMIAGFNDSLEDAERVRAMLVGIPAKVNLIPYNENSDRDLRSPDEATVTAFQKYLLDHHQNCTVRTTRGEDISAACGQLGKAKEQIETNGWLEGARTIAGMANG